MAFRGQFTYGIPVTATNIVDALPDNAVIPASVVGSLKGEVLGISLVDLKSQVGGGSHYIGEHYQGGVIYHLYKDPDGSEHGLIVSIDYQSLFEIWSDGLAVPATATSTWNGLSNTNAASIQPGATYGAWKLCQDYTYDGYNDWFLPSVDQLTLLWDNRFNVNKTLSNIGGIEIYFNDLWSSTEYNYQSAFTFSFFDGRANITAFPNKNYQYHVRAIRQF